MKTIVLSVAMFLGTFAFVNANNVNNEISASNVEAVVAIQQNGYEDVKIESLNAQVQQAIKGYEASYTVKSLAYDKAKKTTKVTLVSNADKTEKVVVLDDQGKEIKEKQ